MNNQTMCHNFFYQNESTRGSYSGMAVSFDRNTFYSYGTAIGAIVKDRNGADVLLVSSDNHSNTTAKHLNHLRAACPFGYNNIISVPTKYGSGCLTIEDSINYIFKYLNGYHTDSMRLKANRESFIQYYQTLERINERLCGVTIPAQFTELYNFIHDPDAIKKAQAEQRQKQSAERKAIKEALKDMLAKNTYSYNAAYAFEYNSSSNTEAVTRKNLKTLLTQSGAYSLIWFSGDDLKTSQRVTIDKAEAITLMRLYMRGGLKVGGRVADKYNILAVNDKYVTVGCHKISRENIEALLKEAGACEVAA